MATSERRVLNGKRQPSRTMRAAAVDGCGPPEVVQLAEAPRPEPGNREVLVRVQSAAVTSPDSRIRGACSPAAFGPLVRLAFGVTRPRRRILGSTSAGIIDAVGADVDRCSRSRGSRLGGLLLTTKATADFDRLAPPIENRELSSREVPR